MQDTIVSCNENSKNNKLFVNDGDFSDNNKLFINYTKSQDDGNFSDNYFDNNNIRIANTNDIKILYILFSNNLLDFSIISQCNRVIYVVDVTHKVGFVLFAKIFIAQLYNFPSLKTNKLHII